MLILEHDSMVARVRDWAVKVVWLIVVGHIQRC
jgi:hypothetical protein